MHDCHKIAERLVELVFDELSEEGRRQLLAEVNACEPCRAEYRALEKTLSTFEAVSAAMMPDEDYWSGYQARLRAKLAADEPQSFWQAWRAGLRGFATKPAWAVALAALLLMALFIWVFLRQTVDKPQAPQRAEEKPPVIEPNAGKPENEQKNAKGPGDEEKRDNLQPQPKQPQETDSIHRRDLNSVAGVRPDKSAKPGQTKIVEKTLPQMATRLEPYASISAVVDEETLRHFEKSQLLLRAFRNAAAGEAVEEIADDRQRSRDLLFKNVLLRREAEAKGNLAVEQVLGDLEPLLLDIANLPEGATPDDLRAVRERMQKREIIATLQVYSARPVYARATTQ
jgi:hypothetical protein